MRPSVLIVDDRKANLLVIRATLQGLDVDVEQADSGQAALALSAAREPAVVLLDVHMPGMDGFLTAQNLRRQEGREHVPIIFVTAASPSESHLFEGYSSGGVDYIVKPIDPLVLRAKVQVFAELYRKAAEVRRLSEDLRQKNADLERFAAVVSHDLRNPLNVIDGIGNLLADRFGGKNGAEFDELLGRVTESARRMDELVVGLLRYSTLGEGGVLEEVELEDALDWALENLRSAIETSGASIERDPLPRLMADQTQVRQLFQNLVSNAIKFRSGAPPRIRISATPSDGSWSFSVSDNGIGVDPVDQQEIFGMFRRLHGEAEYSGTGIGLALIKRVVEWHGGEIRVESALGEGSTFHFTLSDPAGRSDGPAAPAPAPPQAK